VPRSATPSDRWSTAQRRLHWLVAGGIIGASLIAVTMTHLQTNVLLLFVLYQLHKTIGLLVLAGTLARLGLLLRRGRPPHPDSFTPLQRRAAQCGHIVLYGLMVVVPVLGYLTNSTSPSRIPVLFMMLVPLPNLTPADAGWNKLVTELHHLAAFTLLGVAVLHALVAVHHHRRGLPILRRMWSR
jgi:cytochrome b561